MPVFNRQIRTQQAYQYFLLMLV